MFEISSVIGKSPEKATKILNDNGFKNVKIVDNFKKNELNDTKLVCSAKKQDDCVILVCGEFYLNLKR